MRHPRSLRITIESGTQPLKQPTVSISYPPDFPALNGTGCSTYKGSLVQATLMFLNVVTANAERSLQPVALQAATDKGVNALLDSHIFFGQRQAGRLEALLVVALLKYPTPSWGTEAAFADDLVCNGNVLIPPLADMHNTTLKFGQYKPTTGGAQFHPGVDIAARDGAPVAASITGAVQFIGWIAAMGNTLVIRGGSDYIVYANLKSVPNLKVGQLVAAGQPVARVGPAGGPASRAHLHFEFGFGGPFDYRTAPLILRKDPSLCLKGTKVPSPPKPGPRILGSRLCCSDAELFSPFNGLAYRCDSQKVLCDVPHNCTITIPGYACGCNDC